jgi:hypothetical protein
VVSVDGQLSHFIFYVSPSGSSFDAIDTDPGFVVAGKESRVGN